VRDAWTRQRRRARAGLIVIAACGVHPAAAGLLTTERTLADFSFAGDQVDYAPDSRSLSPTVDSAYSFTATDPTLGLGRADNTHDPLRGSLHLLLKGSNYGYFEGADFNTFGSLQTLERLTESRLLTDAITALRPDSKPGPLDFLIDRDRIVGRLASRYRGVGIFMVVNGVDDLTWVQGYADGAATMEILDVEDGAINPAGANRGK